MSSGRRSKSGGSPTTPLGKKLIQARLPFKSLTPSSTGAAATSQSAGGARKRKLSAVDDSSHIAKINRISDSHQVSLEISDDEEVVSAVVHVVELTSDDDPTTVTPNEALTVTPTGRKTRTPLRKTPLSRQKSSRKSSSPRSSKKRKHSADDEEVECVSDKTQFLIKLPLPKKRTDATTSTKNVPESKLHNDVDTDEIVSVGKLADIDDSSLSEDVTVVDSQKPVDAGDPCSIDMSSDEDKPSSSVADDAKDENESTDSPPKKVLSVAIGPVEMNRLTPKQLQRKTESEARLMEKQRAKELREKKLNDEKEAKQKERDEKERARKKEREDKEEQRRKEREDKEDQKRREKEDRDKKKQAELDAKNEERKKKEEQKEQERKQREEQKELEKRKREEEKIAREEAKNMKERKLSQALTKFFVPSKGSNRKAEPEVCENDDTTNVRQNFMPFRIKGNMKLAPIVRRVLPDVRRKQLEDVVNSDGYSKRDQLYLHRLRHKLCLPAKDGKTWLSDDNDLFIIEDDLEGTAGVIEQPTAKQKYRAKFLKFEENRRPAYYGTWRKSSGIIKARKPFVTDTKYFDYEIDSDDEWEEEEPGESLHGSEDEKDKESEDDYDIDNEFFVPHGHLSDEEVLQGEDIDDDNSPDAQKAKLKIIQKQFADEMKKKTEKIKPTLVGVIWQNRDGSRPDTCSTGIWNMLNAVTMIFSGKSISMKPPPESIANSDVQAVSNKHSKMSDANIADLVRLVHGSTNASGFLIKEFRAFLAQQNSDQPNYKGFSNIRIRSKIKHLAEWTACPEEGPMHNKFCWFVPAETRDTYGVTGLTLPNAWQYILTKPKKIVEGKNKDKELPVPVNVSEAMAPVKPTKAKTTAFSIAKFTKVLSEEDKKKQFSTVAINEKATILTTLPAQAQTPVIKKRVNLLLSVPRGQAILTPEKNALISKFLQSTSNASKPEAVDVIEIDN